jgi:excisionase family DNA binding protein
MPSKLADVIPPTERMLLTVRETAALLSVSEPTVKRWLYSGKLQYLKIGAVRRIMRSEALRFAVAEQQATTERLAAARRKKAAA